MSSQNTNPMNATGLPAITMPCGFTEGSLPIGVQFIGRPFDEISLFQVASGYEAVSSAQDRWPALVSGG